MKHKATRHTTLTDNGAKVYKTLQRAGFYPHPGHISGRSGRGGQLRLKISSDSSRTRIRVAGGGVQEIFLYGSVNLKLVVTSLREVFGQKAIETVTANPINHKHVDV
ncbi:MAG: hypothetical protein HQL69_06855 [Magnetococcales bacterium]|nr:hypothetical protein [Magnetococcales bacterium]